MRWTVVILFTIFALLCGVVAIELGMLLVYTKLPHLRILR